MMIVLTQNKAIINISDFKTICVEHDAERPADEMMIVCDSAYILGFYNINEVTEVIAWMAESISNTPNDTTTMIVMPPAQTVDQNNEGKTDAEEL